MKSISKILWLAGFSLEPPKSWRYRLSAFLRGPTKFYRHLSGFWGRFAVLITVVFLASTFNTTPNGLLKVVLAAGFLVSAESLVLAWYNHLMNKTLDWFKTVFRLVSRRGIEKLPLTPALRDVANRMGVGVEQIWVMNDFDNAFSLPMWKVVVIGRSLLDRLSEKALAAVFAHELAHIKGRHNLIAPLSWLILTSQLFLWRELPFFMLLIAGFAFYLLASIPVSWTIELLADKKAAEVVSKESMIEALKLLGETRMNEFSETHPSPSRRIRRLQKGPFSRIRFGSWITLWVVGSYALVFLNI